MLPPRLRHTVRKDKTKIRSRAHLNWVKQHACVIPMCNSERPIDPCHMKTGGGAGMGLKSCDTTAVSMCRDHHDEQHRIGEEAFFAKYDPLVMAARGNTILGIAAEFAASSPPLRKLGYRPPPANPLRSPAERVK
jgi:hypothetical protein